VDRSLLLVAEWPPVRKPAEEQDAFLEVVEERADRPVTVREELHFFPTVEVGVLLVAAPTRPLGIASRLRPMIPGRNNLNFVFNCKFSSFHLAGAYYKCMPSAT
jgi:hypothetical protein